jgi:hypothetical protein
MAKINQPAGTVLAVLGGQGPDTSQIAALERWATESVTSRGLALTPVQRVECSDAFLEAAELYARLGYEWDAARLRSASRFLITGELDQRCIARTMDALKSGK